MNPPHLHGLCKIYWVEDDTVSVAAVGSDSAGRRWYAPTNWITGIPCFDWSKVDRVELVMTQEQANEPEHHR